MLPEGWIRQFGRVEWRREGEREGGVGMAWHDRTDCSRGPSEMEMCEMRPTDKSVRPVASLSLSLSCLSPSHLVLQGLGPTSFLISSEERDFCYLSTPPLATP